MENEQMKTLFQQKIDTELTQLRTSALQRETLCQNATGGYPMKRKLTVGLVIALILFLTTVTALAMELSGWGVLEWLYQRDTRQTLSTATPVTHGDTDHRVATLELRELTTDGYGVYLSLAVTPKEEGVLILNHSVIPFQTPASQVGLAADDPEQTVAEWAAVNGYQKMYQISLYGDVRSYATPMRIESDGTTLIMLSGEYCGEDYIHKIRYKFSTFPEEKTYWELFSDDGDGTVVESHDAIERTMYFTVKPPEKMQTEVLAEYLPAPDQQQPKEYPKVTGVTLVRTPLAAYYDVSYIHPAAEDRRKDTYGEPGFFELQFFDRQIWMSGWSIETLGNGSVQYHYIRSCHLPDPLPEQLSLECSIEKMDPEFGDHVGIIYNHVTLNRK